MGESDYISAEYTELLTAETPDGYMRVVFDSSEEKILVQTQTSPWDKSEWKTQFETTVGRWFSHPNKREP